MRRALFLDRDGVINIDHGYIWTRDRFDFVDGIFDLCRHAAARDYLLFVVTNQAGIGRGYYTEADFLSVTEWMCATFRERGAPISKVYFCPFHPEFGVGDYKRESDLRKPGPGMILQAAREFPIDLAQSVLIGDRETDIEAGRAAGLGRTVLYRPEDHALLAATPSIATNIVQSLREALPFLDEHAIVQAD